MTLYTEGFVREEELLYDLIIGHVLSFTSYSIAVKVVLTSLQTNNSSGSVVNMFSPKQKRATLIRVSCCRHVISIYLWLNNINSYGREIVQNIPLRLVCEHHICRYRQRTTSDK